MSNRIPALDGRAEPPSRSRPCFVVPALISSPASNALVPTPLAASKMKQFPPKEGWGFRVVPVSRILVLGQKGVIATCHPCLFTTFPVSVPPLLLPLPAKENALHAEPCFPSALNSFRHFCSHQTHEAQTKPRSPLSGFATRTKKTEGGNSPPSSRPLSLLLASPPLPLTGPPILGGDEAIFALREAETLV